MSENTTGENWALDGIDANFLQQVRPNEGARSRERPPKGDYRFKITALEQKAKLGAKPHVMIVPTMTIVKAYDEANASGVGLELLGWYAGSPQSPKMLQERLACLILACDIKLGPGQKLT